MQKLRFVQKNEVHKLFWDFEPKTDPPDLGQTTPQSEC